MIVANRLTDGRVVFLGAGSRWVESIEDGLIVDSEASRDELLARAEHAAETGIVVDPYVIDIVIEGERRRPARLREAIRAFGPTVAGPAGS